MIPFKNVEQLKAEGWTEIQLTQQQVALARGVDVSMLDATLWNAAQMRRRALMLGHYLADTEQSLDWAERAPRQESGRPFVGMDPQKWSAEQMAEQHFALMVGLDLSLLDPGTVTWQEMRKHGFFMTQPAPKPAPAKRAAR